MRNDCVSRTTSACEPQVASSLSRTAKRRTRPLDRGLVAACESAQRVPKATEPWVLVLSTAVTINCVAPEASR